MLVRVGSHYAYRWRGKDEDIAVGDSVRIPPSWLDELKGNYSPKVVTVEELNFDAGDFPADEIVSILGKV